MVEYRNTGIVGKSAAVALLPPSPLRWTQGYGGQDGGPRGAKRGGQRSEVRDRRSEVREQRTDDRRQAAAEPLVPELCWPSGRWRCQKFRL